MTCSIRDGFHFIKGRENETRNGAHLSYESSEQNKPRRQSVNPALIFPFFLFLSVIVISISSFATIAFWSHARRREREAFYKSESIRRLQDIQTPNSMDLPGMVREENRYQSRRSRDRSRLAGLVTAGVGAGLMIFLYAMLRTETTEPVYLVALIPVFIGGSLLLHSYLIETK
jgi:hypothetical protein